MIFVRLAEKVRVATLTLAATVVHLFDWEER